MPLAPIDSVDRSALRWLRTNPTVPEYTLLAGETAIAIVRWAHRTGARATAETADGIWTLGRSGFLVPHLTVRRQGSDDSIARLTNRLGHHDIEVGGGGSYRLKRAGLLLPAWRVWDAGGEERLHIEAVAENRRLEGGAVIPTGALPPRELLLLTVLSWYLIVLLWIEDETIEALVPFEGPDAPARFGSTRG
ncbi:MAG TPA: hypothetical protein VML94_01725 [Thermoplasmata archaeon]|nr:hypothetical protein [Thermoplasmata archaeon]